MNKFPLILCSSHKMGTKSLYLGINLMFPSLWLSCYFPLAWRQYG